ncbi:alpha/beta fold hydrolase [Demequina flava]|uniref:alpha/beta fold hydrolase n=1 Tax=Demequina flava TaxID=1095025 RepID=UPI0007866118|nr:alpha/beta hydrolase [Demequina flava]
MNVATSQDGTTLAYDIQGEGPPLIYVTGATVFRRFGPIVKDAKSFAKAFQVITYDRRGRGDSGAGEPWSLEREVDDLEAMIDQVGGKAYVYGHSSGAVIALHAAHRLGEKVQATMLYDAPWVADEKEKDEYAALRSHVDDLLDRGKDAAALRRFLTGIGMPRVFVALLPMFGGWRTMVALAPTVRYDMELTADLPPTEVAAAVTSPVHVVVGERSPASLHVVADALATAVGGEVAVIPKQDHMVAPEVLLPELVARLKP